MTNNDLEAVAARLTGILDRYRPELVDGTIYATDGRVGVLKQVVVDETLGEVSDLIIRVDGSDRVILVPPDLVDKTAGAAVFLTVDHAAFAAHVAGAPA